jgi:hypothetical protein
MYTCAYTNLNLYSYANEYAYIGIHVCVLHTHRHTDTQTHRHMDTQMNTKNTSGTVGVVNAVRPREFEGARKMVNCLVKFAPSKCFVAKILCACIDHFLTKHK